MKIFIKYLKDYFRKVPFGQFLIITLLVALLVTLNYTLGIESRIKSLSSAWLKVSMFYLFYLSVYGTACLIHLGLKVNKGPDYVHALVWLFAAPLFFAIKMVPWKMQWMAGGSEDLHFFISILQMPLRLLFLLLFLWTVHNLMREKELKLGLSFRGFDPMPYLSLLLMMIPLIALASTRGDFLNVYPKFQHLDPATLDHSSYWPWRLLFELSYGMDFITIELFFRGLLVVTLMRYWGMRSILPMAAFYCTVHFGKPLGECVSAYFGGLVLGVIAYRTRQITGGLIVHLGIAWLMELGGWMGHVYVNSRH
jgi:hypothetical protein